MYLIRFNNDSIATLSFLITVSDDFFDRVVNVFLGKRKKLYLALNKNPYVTFKQDVQLLLVMDV